MKYLGQGKNCRWNLDIDSLFKVHQQFASEQDLDSFLEGMLPNIKITGEDNAIFSVDFKANPKKILNDIKLEVDKNSVEVVRYADDPDEIETYTKIPHSIGTTRFVMKYGNAVDLSTGIISEFNLNDWENHFIEERIANGESEIQAREEVNMQENELWPSLTQYGTDVHAVLEASFKDEEFVPTKDTKITEEQILQVKKYAEQLKFELKRRHGENCEFLTEFAFKSKELAPEIKAILKQHGYTSINGKADLLVLDEFGNVHIYDYKVSRKNVFKDKWGIDKNSEIPSRQWVDGHLMTEGEWKSAKKRTATNQLAIYTAILRQYGLNVKSASLIPIQLDFDYESEFKINKINNINFKPLEECILNVPGATAGKEISNVNANIIKNESYLSGEEMKNVFDIFQGFFPGINSDTSGNVQRKQTTVDYLKRNNRYKVLNSSDSHFPEYKYSFSRVGIGLNETIYCKTEEELDEKLLDYVNELNSKKVNEVLDLGHLISEIMDSPEKDFTKIIGNIPKENQSKVQNEFKKYIVQEGWKLESDDTMISAGFFIFSRGSETEIIALTNELLFSENNLGFGTTLLGKNTRNKYVGSKKILSASNANLEMMKVMIYIAENQEMFKSKKITQIKAMNPWSGQVSDCVLNSQLLQNYQTLCMKNPDIKTKTIDPIMFASDTESLISIAQSMCQMLNVKVIDFSKIKFEASQVGELINWTKSALYQLEYNYKELANKESAPSSPVWDIYVTLNKVLLQLNGINTSNEIDKGLWKQGGISMTGLNVASAQFSASKNIQEFAVLHDRYVAEVRTKIQKDGFKLQQAFRELYKAEGVTGARVYESWFRRDENGNISQEFMLKDPDSSDFNGSEVARKVLRLYLDTMYKLRYPDATNTDIEVAKNTGDYYKVPLTEAVFSRQVKHLGLVQTVKNKVNQYKEITEGVFAGESDIKEQWENENDSLYNKFRLNDMVRREKLERHGTGFFETNLEIVYNQALVAYTKQQVSEKYVPLFRAMKLALKRAQDMGGNDLKNVRETLDKLIDNKFYGKPIMDKKLRPWYVWISMINSMFTTMKLGLNVRSFLREMLTGLYIGTTRVMVKQTENVSLESYNKAISYILQDLPNNITGISKLQQLNALYGMANYSLGNVVNERKVNWLNINNWGRDTLFIGCSAPDYQHRMAILMAKMLDDGCWDAFSLDDNGELQYDFTKDKRFEVYLSGNTNDPKYLDQKSLYLKNIEEWNAQGYVKEDGTLLKEGDALPQPYTTREAQSIKNYADILYGHYDDESKSLMNDMFLGSFFMQFKTFVTAKLEQWTMTGGVYNVEYLKQQYDPITNEKLFQLIKYPNENNTGMPYKKIIKESEIESLSEDEKKEIMPYIEWTGQPMEGMAMGLWNFCKSLVMDREQLKELWNNPTEKGLFLLGMSDGLLMILLGFIITALFGQVLDSENFADIPRDIRNNGPITSMAYSVLMGVTSDGPITSVLYDMLSDVNPPVLTNFTQFTTSMWSLITGKSSLAYALTRNFGFASDFSGLVKQWEKSQE